MGGRADARCKGHAFGARLVSQGRPARRCPGRFFFAQQASETDARERAFDCREITRSEQPDMHKARVEIVRLDRISWKPGSSGMRFS